LFSWCLRRAHLIVWVHKLYLIVAKYFFASLSAFAPSREDSTCLSHASRTVAKTQSLAKKEKYLVISPSQ
jgi:uncharacterized membrane protein YccC